MKYISATLLLTLIYHTAVAQFVLQGKVEYEKRTNIKMMFNNEYKSSSYYSTEYVNSLVPVYVSYHHLYFTEKAAVYKYDRDSLEQKYSNSSYITYRYKNVDDILYNNLENGTSTQLKVLFNTKFLIKDTPKRHLWILGDEIRMIAGYACRKATTTIDSMVVIAYYTEQIVPSIGPEGVTDLPGLVLGMAIPQMYTTWFATKVDLFTPTAQQLSEPTKGKKRTLKELLDDIPEHSKDFNQVYNRYLKILNL